MKAFIWIVRILLALVLLVLLVASGALLYSSSVKQESPPTLLGYAPFTVANGEMTPSLYPGDLAILRMGSQCQPGDIVAFQQDGELLLRRIVGTSEGMYITQQEAFGQPDVNLLDPARVVAVCTTFLPGCGALAAFLFPGRAGSSRGAGTGPAAGARPAFPRHSPAGRPPGRLRRGRPL